MADQTCAQCHESYRDTARFCPRCGTASSAQEAGADATSQLPSGFARPAEPTAPGSSASEPPPAPTPPPAQQAPQQSAPPAASAPGPSPDWQRTQQAGAARPQGQGQGVSISTGVLGVVVAAMLGLAFGLPDVIYALAYSSDGYSGSGTGAKIGIIVLLIPVIGASAGAAVLARRAAAGRSVPLDLAHAVVGTAVFAATYAACRFLQAAAL